MDGVHRGTLSAMCGRFTQTAAFDVLAKRFDITIEAGSNEELTARYNVAPSQEVRIITATDKGRGLVMARWGFRPVSCPTSACRRRPSAAADTPGH